MVVLQMLLERTRRHKRYQSEGHVHVPEPLPYTGNTNANTYTRQHAPPVYAISSINGIRQVSVILSRHGPLPQRPIELTNVISDEEFKDRCVSIRLILEKYYWRFIVRLWFAAAFFFSLVAPWPAIVFARRAILKRDYDAIREAEREGRLDQPIQLHPGDYALAHLATFGIILAFVGLSWGPYAYWRRCGTRDMYNLVKSFPNPESDWQVRYVKNFAGSVELAVRVPAMAPYGGGGQPWGAGPEAYGWLPEYKREP